MPFGSAVNKDDEHAMPARRTIMHVDSVAVMLLIRA